MESAGEMPDTWQFGDDEVLSYMPTPSRVAAIEVSEDSWPHRIEACAQFAIEVSGECWIASDWASFP